MYYLFPLGFAPFNTFHFNVSFTDCLSLFIKWREREKREVKTRKQMTPTTSSYSGTHTHTNAHQKFLDSNASMRLVMLYSTMKACAIRDYNRHQITIIQLPPGGGCRRQELRVSWSHSCSGILAGLGISLQVIIFESLDHPPPPRHTHTQIHTHTPTHRHTLCSMYIVWT